MIQSDSSTEIYGVTTGPTGDIYIDDTDGYTSPTAVSHQFYSVSFTILHNYDDLAWLKQTIWEKSLWVFRYWEYENKLLITNIFFKARQYYIRILRCNRKGIGLRLRNNK